MSLNNYGILIDYNWCTGCHTCEIACQMLKGLPVGQYGIKIAEMGPWEIEEDVWQYSYIPCPTDQCDLCNERIELGMTPSCVKHCQAKCMEFGPLDQLVKKMYGNPKTVLFSR